VFAVSRSFWTWALRFGFTGTGGGGTAEGASDCMRDLCRSFSAFISAVCLLSVRGVLRAFVVGSIDMGS